MYKVTIAMPVYNVETYVEQALLSALNQTFESIEYLIIDDRGTDNSMPIVKNIKANHPRGKDIRIIDHGKNIGLGAARNSSIENAQGEYIYFMDSDDTISKDTIQIMFDSIKDMEVDVVECSYKICTEDGELLSKHILPLNEVRGEYAICRWMKENNTFYDGYSWNRMFSIDFLRRNNIRCIPNHRNEDVFMSFQIVLYAKSYISLPYITYSYYMRHGSITHQKANINYFDQYLEILEARTNLMCKLGVDKPELLCNYYLQHFFEWWIFQILNSNIISEDKKQEYYNKIRLNIFNAKFSIKELIGLRYKYLYLILYIHNFQSYLLLYKAYYYMIRIIRGVLNRLNMKSNIGNPWIIRQICV